MPQTMRPTDPWNVDALTFPRAGTLAEQLTFALRYAILAPSAHNTQPWAFRVHGDCVDVLADRGRELPIADPSNRELVLSCGAAMFFLRAALHRFGIASETTLVPDPAQPNLLARVRAAPGVEPTAAEAVLAHAIRHRHTNRAPFQDRVVDPELVRALERAAQAESAWLVAVADSDGKAALAALVARADREQLADHAFVSEMASWMRDPAAEDGMPTHGVPVDEAGARALALPQRTFAGSGGAPATDDELAAGSPLLVVIGTDGDGEREWVQAGAAMGRVLLKACASGVHASFLNQPLEVPRLRPLVAEAAGHAGSPHVLLRLGYGTQAPPTPRRPMEETLAGR